MVVSEKVVLGRDVRMIMLKFNFSNPNVIPRFVKHLNQETDQGAKDELLFRKNRSGGVLAIESTERCSIAKFLGEVAVSGYEMVDAFYKKGIDTRDPSIKRKNHTVCFFFARSEFVKLSDEFKKERPLIYNELWKICKTAMWRVRLFLNPFYKDGEEINGQYALSVNLDVRQPLYCPDGQPRTPVMVWQKDKNGKRVGETTIPLKAEYHLRVKDNTISLMTA